MIYTSYLSLFSRLSFDVSIKQAELNSEKERHEYGAACRQKYEVDVEIAL